MAQPQPQAPQRTFSPKMQLNTPLVPHAAAFPGQPPSKKPRLSPAPSPQGMAQSPGALFSPGAVNTGLNSARSPATPSTPNSLGSPLATPSSSNALPPSGPPLPLPSPAPLPSMASPGPNPASALPGGPTGLAANGHSPQKMHLSAASPQTYSPRPLQTPTPPTPTGPMTPSGPPLPNIAPAPSTPGAVSTNGHVFVPMAMNAPAPGVMGPPSKPVEKPVKEYQYDVDDSLAGTGIDLRQEEQFQAEYYAGTFRPEARTGFPANAPGRRSSFYGSLFANQPAETIDEANQRKIELETAKQAWNDAAKSLATARSNALHDRFLEFGALHLRADKIAKEYGLGINLEPKTAPSSSARARHEPEFPKPSVMVKTQVGPDGVAFVSTVSSFVPEDTFLADQLALLSLATKHRLRELLEDANKVALTRQNTAHGVVPAEWLEAAAPLPSAAAASASKEGETGKNPLKRPLEAAADAADGSDVAKKITGANTLIQSLRAVSKTARSIEEQRLLKRQKREAKKADLAAGASATGRAGGPGTPGGVAPEPEKPPTKKELKKNAAAKVAEHNDTLSANRTSMAFLGGRKKEYSWLNSGSGASTPKRGALGGAASGAAGGGSSPAAAGGAGAGGGAAGRRPGEPAMLTAEGRTKWGSWREDGIKGKDIQLRDLVVVLEADGREAVALQTAYDKLDGMPQAAFRPET